jgi:hypothetical protein
MDFWHDIDEAAFARWIRGRIKNVGDRGVERCRVKLLDVEGRNVPDEARNVKNGFLQWQGGIRDSMRLNPGEYWIFDIGTRALYPDSPLRLCAHFVKTESAPLVSCSLPAPGTYKLTLAIYGDNIQSQPHIITIKPGTADHEIEFL